MTAKRFTIDVETENYENAYFENDKFLCYEDDYDAILNRLNELHEENKELKGKLEVYRELYPSGKWICDLNSDELKKELEE